MSDLPHCYICLGEEASLLNVPCRKCQRGSVRVHQRCLEQSLSSGPFLLSISNIDEREATGVVRCHVCQGAIIIRLHLQVATTRQRFLRYFWRFYLFMLNTFLSLYEQNRAAALFVLYVFLSTVPSIFIASSAGTFLLRALSVYLLVYIPSARSALVVLLIISAPAVVEVALHGLLMDGKENIHLLLASVCIQQCIYVTVLRQCVTQISSQ